MWVKESSVLIDVLTSAMLGATAHPDGSPWWRETIPPLWYILFCPGYCFWLSLRQSQPIMRVEMVSQATTSKEAS